jgi:gliding motility-associated-like protein
MKRVFSVILFLLLFSCIYSQYTTTGTKFWLSYHENFETNANPILYITSDVGATGTVSIPGTGWTQNFNIAPLGSATVNLPAATAIISNQNTVLNRAIYVESSSPVAVYAANQRQASSDATLVLPIHALGDSYIVNTYSPFSTYSSQFVVVGIQDNTSIEIVPTANLQGSVNAGVPLTINLNQGDVYFVKSSGDLTGTTVKAVDTDNCFEFALFAGNKCANVPLSCQYCDHLFEQMIPVKAWGQKYVTTPLMTRNGDLFRIMASEDFTSVSINGGANIFLNAGQFHEVYLLPASYINSDKPISVGQYSRGTTCDGVTSDPFMVMLSATEQLIPYIVFQAFNTPVINNFYTNVVARTEYTGTVLLDGATIPGWATVPSNPEYSYVRRNISQGTHVLESPHGLLAIVYGFGNADSYGYQAGANIQPLNVSFDVVVEGSAVPYDEFSDSLDCNFLTVDFQTITPDIYDVSWSFGDGDIYEGTEVTYTFPSAGEYLVTMYYMRLHSCVLDSLYTSIIVHGEFPEAWASGPHCIGETAQLTGSDAVSYEWTGPNGFFSTEQNPQIPNFQEENQGVYTLTTLDSGGCPGSIEVEVNLHEYEDLIAENTGEYCEGETIFLDADPAGMEGYEWTGPGGYSASSQSPQIVSSHSSMSGTYTVVGTNVHGCTMSANTQVVVHADVDASIDPVPDLCIVDPIYILNAQSNGGVWSGPGVNQNSFNPADAGIGTHTIDYSVVNGTCSDESSTSINVFDNIFVEAFSDHECNDTYDEYTVTFNVVDSYGNPAEFLVNDGISTNQYSGTYTEIYPSATPYSLTVTDLYYACNEYIFNGVRDCGCFTFAGTMSSLQLVNLCEGECTDMVLHDDNQELDGNDIYEFVLHDGSYPINILARNTNPEFCFHLISGLNYGQTYYISAIAGNELGGQVDLNEPCYSQSQGTPVAWYSNPIAHVNSTNFSTCGSEIDLSAVSPDPGQYGSWSASADFWSINGTSIYDSEMSALVADFGEITFTWTISNGVCHGTDNVVVNFLPTPTAYAGENFAICGTNTSLEAVYSLDGTTGQWSGPGTFDDATSPTSEVSIGQGYGNYTFTWRESVGSCFTEDQVTVTFIPEPNPTIVTSNDTVCGISHNLSVSNVQGTGMWAAYSNGELMSPTPNYLGGIQNPNTQVIIPNYSGTHFEIEFVWTETLQTAGIQCVGTASQNVVFSKMPMASVGAIDEAEICGHCFQFSADTTGSGWATGRWVAPGIIHEFDGSPYDPNATVCIDSIVSFGNGGRIRVPFLWVMTNYACSAIDTMNVTFYKRPKANAGLNNSICGNYYELGAVFSMPHSSSYSPTGSWLVHTKPNPSASADIVPSNNDTVDVSVSHYGQWVFQFRENNSFLTSCYSTDTVRIEFVEIPVVDAGEDKHVCGTCTEMEAVSSGFAGSWLPSGQTFPNEDFDNPTAFICVNQYGARDFIWQESNTALTSSLSCTSQDSVEITFWREPQALILTDEADSTTCGLTFNNLRAQLTGSGITGFWWNETDPDAVYGDPNSNNTHVTVSTYGYHDFYWIASNGPSFMPGFCNDTAGPLRIHFIEIPTANAGNDTLYCGYCGNLDAIPSVGTGVWSTPSSALVVFDDINDPNAEICSQVLNTGNATYPYFDIIWTEDNTNGCTDKDTIKVIFARIPHSGFDIVPPKCLGEPATLSAQEDSLQQYQWNFYSGIIDSTVNNEEYNANFQHFVYWQGQDTSHRVSLIVTNFWGCQSAITIDTVYEPPIPDFGVIIVNDTCLLGRGGIIFEDTVGTNAFYWLDSTTGPTPGTPITAVYNLPEGDYDIRARYRTPNQTWYNYYINTFGNAMCTDTISYTIEPIGLLLAEFEIPIDIWMEDLVAPEAEVTFVNNSDYGGVRRRCIWHFGDGTTLTSCDDIVYHTYTEADCYNPFLIVMNRDLQECRDTAFIEECIRVENASSIEVPNIFTPNGDGINDFFQVKAETLREFQGYVVNRWGKVIYEWTNWQDEEAGWDGKMRGGTKASTGVYFYIIKAVGHDDEPYDLYGAFHLLRD